MTKARVGGRAVVWAVAGLVMAAGCGEPAGEDDTFQEVSALAVSQPARPIAPLSGSLTGSARPVLRWAGPSQAVIEICADRHCHHQVASFSGTGNQARPPRALPSGVVYWRLLTRGPRHGSASSVVWELFVPRIDGGNPVANRGLRYDADADGYADAAVREQNGNAVTDALHVFEGGPHGLRATRATILPLDVTYFGVGMSAAGDTNGDGFGDVAVSDGRGVVVYAGSPSGVGTTPLVVIPLPAGVNGIDFGFELTGLGDVNGDGYGDIAAADQFRRVWVFLGGPSGPATVAAWVLDRSAVPDRYVRLPTAGDLNGDGFGDLVLTDYGSDGTPTGFRFFRGGAGGLEAPTAGTLVTRPTFPIPATGDVDGDGVIDLVTTEGPSLALFAGGPGFPPAAPAQVVPLSAQPGPVQLGDFDGDGDFDLAARTATATSNMFFTDDRIDLYRGGPVGLATTPTRTLLETDVLPDNQLIFGGRLGNADFDGDGREDLLVAAPVPYPTPFFDTSAGVVLVYEGSHRLVDRTPAVRLDGGPGFADAVSAGAPQSGP